MQGIIILKQKNIYEVKIKKEIFMAEITGNIKKSKNLPIVGDIVNCHPMVDNDRLMIDSFLQRKNMLKRPLVANVDQAIIVNSTKEPEMSTYLIDKMLAIIEVQDIKPIILITKKDLITDKDKEVLETVESYKKDGYDIFLFSNLSKNNIEEIKDLLRNKLSVITGQTGVGKTTTLNSLNINLNLATQEISKALNRGKHTTRFNKIYEIEDNSFLIDTPGFSSLEFPITKKELSRSFHDFKKESGKCKFNDCIHKEEKECQIKRLVESNKISKTRYMNYLKFLEELNNG